ncbi:MAG: fluoride efflux transporter FluC [Opitutales bacterium]
MLVLLVALGASLGGVLRYLVMTGVTRRLGEAFPWGTLAVNALGSLLLGAMLGAGFEEGGGWLPFERAHALVGVGFCGGLTTFSTFSLQTLTLSSQRRWGAVAGNVVGGLAFCMGCVAFGYLLCERVTA